MWLGGAALSRKINDGLTNTQRYLRRHPRTEEQKQKAREYTKAWILANPDRSTANRCQTPKGRWQFFRSKAKSRGIPLELSFEQWTRLAIAAKCHYCGEVIRTTGGSLDRKNSSLGYTEANVVPCCLSCNQIRNDDLISYEEMLYIMPLLQAFRAGKT